MSIAARDGEQVGVRIGIPKQDAARFQRRDIWHRRKTRARAGRERETICAEINSRSLGQTVEVLVEDQHKGKWRGRTRQNKLVFIDSALPLRGHLVETQITWTGPWSMQGRFVRDVSPVP